MQRNPAVFNPLQSATLPLGLTASAPSFTAATLAGSSGGQVDAPARCMAWADIDQDGDLDVFVGKHGANALFLNDGNGVFTSTHNGLMTNGFSETWTALFGDVDGDGSQHSC